MSQSLSERLRAIREAAQKPKPPPASAAPSAPAAAPAFGATRTTPRQPSASLTNNSGNVTASNSILQNDEVEQLIRLTRDEVQLERDTGLGIEQKEEEADPAEVEGPDGLAADTLLPPAPSKHDTSNLLRESKGVLGQAALLQSSAPSSPSSPSAAASKPPRSSNGQRSKPVLTRGSSSRLRSQGSIGPTADGSGAEDDSAQLADDLAEALGEDVSRRRAPVVETDQQEEASSSSPRGPSQTQGEAPPSSSRREDSEAETDEIQDEVDALIARFSALRRAREATSAEQGPTSPPARSSSSSPPPAYTSDDSDTASVSGSRDPFAALSLPSVPRSEPSLPPEPSPSSSEPAVHPTLGPAHNDLPADLDLAPFRRLVGRDLDVRRLDEPSERSFDGFPSVPSSVSKPPHAGKEEGEEEETFCSICSAPPTLSCFSPRDPEDEGCMGDVYCSECWVQAHEGMEREELREHRTRDLPRRGGRGGGGGGTRKMGGSGGGRKAVAA